jgi:hypothetical protein
MKLSDIVLNPKILNLDLLRPVLAMLEGYKITTKPSAPFNAEDHDWLAANCPHGFWEQVLALAVKRHYMRSMVDMAAAADPVSATRILNHHNLLVAKTEMWTDAPGVKKKLQEEAGKWYAYMLEFKMMSTEEVRKIVYGNKDHWLDRIEP